MTAHKGATLELAVLGLLHESALHGYELRKRLTLMFGWGRRFSYGSLYPALSRMERAGLIAAEPTTVGRRRKIVYRITEAGRAHFTERVTDSSPASYDDDAFGIRFVLFSRTEAAVRLRILEGRRARLQERLERVQSGAGAADAYVAELRRHSVESVQRELSWLTGLIEAERHTADRPGPAVAEEAPEPDGSPTPTGPLPGGNQT